MPWKTFLRRDIYVQNLLDLLRIEQYYNLFW